MRPDGTAEYFGYANPPGRELVVIHVTKRSPFIVPGGEAVFFCVYWKTTDVVMLYQGAKTKGPAPVFTSELFGARLVNDTPGRT
jgi:hypothetical protein